MVSKFLFSGVRVKAKINVTSRFYSENLEGRGLRFIMKAMFHDIVLCALLQTIELKKST